MPDAELEVLILAKDQTAKAFAGINTNLGTIGTLALSAAAEDARSHFNPDVNDALAAIQAGLRGEADPLERFGVRLSQAAVKAKALEMGLVGATGEMDGQTAG